MRIFRRSPLVSVILPSFNHADFVGDAVRSVLAQSMRDLELIVVDDGSSDGTDAVVAALDDPRLTFIRLADNRAIHPRNLALARARGTYVAFQNSDDVWAPDKLAAQLTVMEGRGRPSACFTTTDLIDAAGLPATDSWASGIFTATNRPATQWLRYFFDVGNCLPLPSAMVRRADLARLGGFRASLVQLGDFDLWVRLAALGEFHIIDQALTQIRIVEHRNASAPAPRTSRRSLIEWASVLESYVQSPILDQFDRIFPDLPAASTTGARKVALALRAWGITSAHRRFADRVMAQVLDDATQRADAIAAHGVGSIHDFLRHRGESEFLWHDPGAA